MSEGPQPQGWPSGFFSGARNRGALLVLSSLRGLKPRQLLSLAHQEGTAESCLLAIRNGKAGSAADQVFARDLSSDGAQASLDAAGARLVAACDPEYPPGLHHLDDPPAQLFIRGARLEPDDGRTRVSVVGARNCTPLGRDVAREIGRGLGQAGAVVVSGAARGIDSASHEGALAARGKTWAVLGSGIDVAYPHSSASLIRRIADVGSVISEYPPGIPAEPFRFPARNRIIAGIASAVVIVEGAEHSGSLITAEHALELGRDVFAVPGAVNNPLARAPLQSIHDGAKMIRGSADLLGDLGLADDRAAAIRAQMSLAEVAVTDLLKGPTLPEVVARELGCDLPSLMPVLLSLEMKGLVRNQGGRFELTVAASAAVPASTT